MRLPLEYFVYQKPHWSIGDRLVACLEVESADAHSTLHEQLGLPGLPRWFHESRLDHTQVQTFGMAWRIEVGPDDVYDHLSEADWDLAKRIDGLLTATHRSARWPDMLLDALLPPEQALLPQRPPSGYRLGHFRLNPDRIEVAMALRGTNSLFKKSLPVGPGTVFDGSPLDGSVVEAFTTQDKLPDGSFGLVARRVVVHRASDADIATAEPAARFLRSLGNEMDARAHVRQWILQRSANATGLALDLDGWFEAAARRAMHVRHLDVVYGPEQAIAQHLAFLDARRLPLDLDPMKRLAAWRAEMDADRRWDDLRPDAMRELVRAGAASSGLDGVQLPSAHRLGVGMLLTQTKRLTDANNVGLLLGAQPI